MLRNLSKKKRLDIIDRLTSPWII